MKPYFDTHSAGVLLLLVLLAWLSMEAWITPAVAVASRCHQDRPPQLAWVAIIAWRIHIEETALLSALGDKYRSYASHCKRLIPLVW
jgi:protein-S-isoprenylcysteine O-methyltransferase Ste14